MKVEIPDNVLRAIQAVIVRDCYDTSGSDSWFLLEYLPVIKAWLEGLGLLPPAPPGGEAPIGLRGWPPEDEAA